MKRYREYMKEGITLSKVCLKNNGIFKYYIYCFLSVLFNITFFLAPYAGVSKYEIKNQIKKNKGITLSTLFRGLDNNNYSKLLVANIIKVGMFFGAFLIIGALAGISYTLGLGISMMTKSNSVMAAYFTIPFSIVLLIFLLAIPFIQGPNAYIANKYNNMSASGIVYNSFNTYKKGGKLINFLFMISNYLPRIIYALLAYLISYGIGYAYARGNGANAGNGLMMIIAILFIIIYLIVAPLISLIHIIAKTELLDDIVIDNYNNDLINNYSSDNIKRIKILKHNKQKSYNLLFADADKYMNNPSYINTLNELETKEENKTIEEKVPEKIDNQVVEEKELENQNNDSLNEKDVIEDLNESQVNEEIVEKAQDDMAEEQIFEEKTEEVQEDIVEESVEYAHDEVGLEPEEEVKEVTDASEVIVEEVIEEPIVEEKPKRRGRPKKVETQTTEEVAQSEALADEEVLVDNQGEEIEEVIYVDEDGNEISPDEIEEVVVEEEESEDSQEDEIDAFLKSIPSKKEE